MKHRSQWLKFAANGLKNQVLASVSAASGKILHKPFFVEAGFSSRCNLKCVQCSQWRENLPEAVTLQRWLGLVKELYDWIGPYQFTTAWAEPFMYESLLEVVSAASSMGISTCVITNGTLIDGPMALRISDSSLGRLVFSIDGACAETHDATRGVPGAFQRTMRGLESVLSLPRRPAVNVATILHGANLQELPELARRVHCYGLEGINFQPLGPSGDGWRKLWPSDMDALDRTVDELIALKRSGIRILNSEWVLRSYKEYFRGRPFGAKIGGCKSYQKMIVRHNGDVYLCRAKAPVGNILRDGGVRGIFSSGPGRKALSAIASCREQCLMMNCHHFNTFYDRARELAGILKL